MDLAAHGIGEDYKGTPIEIGKSVITRQGKDAVLVGYGSSVNECHAAADMLSRQGVQVTVCDARFCKPLDTDMVRSALLPHLLVFTVSCACLLYTSPSPRDRTRSRMPSSA